MNTVYLIIVRDGCYVVYPLINALYIPILVYAWYNSLQERTENYDRFFRFGLHGMTTTTTIDFRFVENNVRL